MAYTQVGLSPDGSSSWFLPRMVGLKRALELTLTNRVLSAQEALDYGLITTVVPDDERARRRRRGRGEARGRARRSRSAARRRLLHTSLEDTFETHLAREADGIARRGHDPRRTEGIAAFVEKRRPEFTGT